MNKDGRTLRLEAALEAARMAGEMLMRGAEGGLQTTSKGRNDFVTIMDVCSERLITDYLHKRFENDNFLGEEMGFEQYGDGGTWIIDPIDGTTNFIHGLPGFTISIAYEEERWHPVVGVVYDPTSKESFTAQEGKGAFLQGEPITVSTVADPHQSVVMISPPLRKTHRMESYLGMFEHICSEAGEVRDYGSAALHLCYAAAGRCEAFIEFGLKYHDIAAGVVILQEAGGQVAPLDLHDTNDWTENIIATNGKLHTWFSNHVQMR